MSTTTSIASIVESLGVTLTLEDDDLVTDAVLIAKVVEADGTERLALTWSDGMSWVTRYGLLTAAVAIDNPLTPLNARDCDGDNDD